MHRWLLRKILRLANRISVWAHSRLYKDAASRRRDANNSWNCD